MRVMFAGISGVERRLVLSKVGDAIGADWVEVDDVVSELARSKYGINVPLPRLLDASHINRGRVSRLYNEALSNAKAKLIGLHLTFYRKGAFYSPILESLDVLSELNVKMVVTLIDDVYDIVYRIGRKEARLRIGTRLSLSGALHWRAVETMVADIVAAYLGVKNYLVAVKHPVEVFARLLAEPNAKLIYVSHPIRLIRDKPDKLKEVVEFKRRLLDAGFVVFDPATIDEGVDAVYSLERRLPLPKEPTVPPTVREMVLNLDEETASIIKEHIEERDYRLISQSHAVVAYRPFMEKMLHKGVLSEMDAAIALGKQLFVYDPKKEFIHDVFYPKSPVCDDFDELVEALRSV